MKVKVNDLVFDIAYIFLFFSFFLGDVEIQIGNVGSIMRYVTYVLLLVQFISLSKFKVEELLWLSVLFFLGILFFLITGDFYWAVVVLIIYNTKKLDDNRLVKFEMNLLIVATITVLLLCTLGILPDILTAREGAEYVGTRHSFGFYHSNVLPLIILYIGVYYVWLKQEKTNLLFIFIWFLTEVTLYKLCVSRNAFYLSILFASFVLIVRKIRIKRNVWSLLEKIEKILVPLYATFSVSMFFLLMKGGIYDKLDSVFSGRFRAGIYKMRNIGIGLIRFISYEDYMKDNIIIDNGYLYVMLRYGMLFIVFYALLNYMVVKKANKNPYKLICIFIVLTANLIDNDLVDYSFLPFIIIAFSDMYNRLQKKINGRRRPKVYGKPL